MNRHSTPVSSKVRGKGRDVNPAQNGQSPARPSSTSHSCYSTFSPSPSCSPGALYWCILRTWSEISRSCSGSIWSSMMKSRSNRDSSESCSPMFSIGVLYWSYWSTQEENQVEATPVGRTSRANPSGGGNVRLGHIKYKLEYSSVVESLSSMCEVLGSINMAGGKWLLAVLCPSHACCSQN